MALILYTRHDCPLCDVAQNLLKAGGWRYDTVNIDTDLDLIQRFGTRIPVLVETTTGRVWDWPFNEQTLQAADQSGREHH